MDDDFFDEDYLAKEMEKYRIKEFEKYCCGIIMERSGPLSLRCLKCKSEVFYCKKCYDDNKLIVETKLEQNNDRINKLHILVGKDKHTKLKGYYCCHNHGSLFKFVYGIELNIHEISGDINK